ncbi:MAG TPA: glycosyltransferase family 39 protein, partial [Candidatus Acidoferrales bacterium]|nr:glycosyltransferase family 39 protein [Candidatus Acidoferrales bacterium]
MPNLNFLNKKKHIKQKENLFNFKNIFIETFNSSTTSAISGNIRTKTTILFLAYSMIVYLSAFSFITRSYSNLFFILMVLFIYLTVSLKKENKNIDNKKKLILFPLLQLTKDIADTLGTVKGILPIIKQWALSIFCKDNIPMFCLIIIYLITPIILISWGIPNQEKIYTYHIDEWRFAMAIKNAFTTGKSDVGGIFYYITEGVLLIPFYLLHIVNPLAVKSSLTNLTQQHRLFEILRLFTMLYGVLSISLISTIVKKYLHFNSFVTIFLFIMTPVFLIMSSLVKVDVAVVFWILLSLYSLFQYIDKKSTNKLIILAVVIGLALAVKISTLPLVFLFFITVLLYSPNKKELIRSLAIGLPILFATVIVFGYPDILTRFPVYYQFIHTNTASRGDTIFLKNQRLYLVTKEYPLIFGYFLYLSCIVSLLYWLFLFIKKVFEKKVYVIKKELVIVTGFIIFLCSLLPFRIDGGGNRALVLLPFMVIVVSMTILQIIHKTQNKWRYLLYLILSIGLSLQIFQSYAWVSVLFSPDPRHVASLWIEKNIPGNSTIGIENIPVDQMLPDNVLFEFYK